MTQQCPFCEYKTPEPDNGDKYTQGWQEYAHMSVEHPEIIEKRLQSAGFLRDDNGSWFDTLATEDSHG